MAEDSGYHYVVVGGGIAGVSCAEEVRWPLCLCVWTPDSSFGWAKGGPGNQTSVTV